MPAKKRKLTEKEQSELFRKAGRDLEPTGELSNTAEAEVDALVGKSAVRPSRTE
jgi:hypothetical protein